MKKINLFFMAVLIVALIGIPVSAQTEERIAASGEAIWSIKLDAPPNSEGTISATLSNGDIITGSWSYTGFPHTTATVNLNGETSTGTYDVTGLFVNLKMMVWNADNQTSGVRKLKMGYGQIAGIFNVWNDYVETDIDKYPITKFTLTSDQNINVNYEIIPYEDAVTKLTQKREDSILDLAYQTFWDALDFGYNLYYWLKFFFIENYLMILSLFLAVPMAFAAKNSRGNPERFLRQYFRTLKGFFEFNLSLWRMLIETIGTIRGWFRI